MILADDVHTFTLTPDVHARLSDAVERFVYDVLEQAAWLIDDGVSSVAVAAWAEATIEGFRPRLIELLDAPPTIH